MRPAGYGAVQVTWNVQVGSKQSSRRRAVSFAKEASVQRLDRPRDIKSADDEGNVHLGRALRDHFHFDALVAQCGVYVCERR